MSQSAAVKRARQRVRQRVIDRVIDTLVDLSTTSTISTVTRRVNMALDAAQHGSFHVARDYVIGAMSELDEGPDYFLLAGLRSNLDYLIATQ